MKPAEFIKGISLRAVVCDDFLLVWHNLTEASFCVYLLLSFNILCIGYFWSHCEETTHMECISQEDHVFSVLNQTKPCPLCWWRRSHLPLSLQTLSPLLVSWARETAVFSWTREERMNTKLWYLAACQNNRKLHTCQLLASRAGKMTNVVFLALSSWQAHHWLHFSLLQFTKA